MLPPLVTSFLTLVLASHLCLGQLTTISKELASSLKVKVLDFTYPPGSNNIPVANWETKATLDLKNLPSSLSICSSYFLKSWIADIGTLIMLFQILDEEGETWGELLLQAGSSNALETETSLVAK